MPFDVTSLSPVVVLKLLTRRMVGKPVSACLRINLQVWEAMYKCTFYTKHKNLEAVKLVVKEIISSGSSHIFANTEI